MRVLDGTNDAFDENRGFEEPSERYKMTPEGGVVTAARTAIVDVLEGVTDLRASFRLGKFLVSHQ